MIKISGSPREVVSKLVGDKLKDIQVTTNLSFMTLRSDKIQLKGIPAVVISQLLSKLDIKAESLSTRLMTPSYMTVSYMEPEKPEVVEVIDEDIEVKEDEVSNPGPVIEKEEDKPAPKKRPGRPRKTK